jgi:hypothetical protein
MQRQAHEDRLDASAGLEPEHSAAVIEQIELDIPATAHELPSALGVAVGLAHVTLEDRAVGGKKMIAGVAHERKHFTQSIGEVVKEDAADPACLTAVRQIKVFVAPLLEPCVVSDWVALADFLPAAGSESRPRALDVRSDPPPNHAARPLPAPLLK